MHGKYYLTEEIKPLIDTKGNVAFTADDVLFDWTAFNIPRGTAAIRSFMFKVAGTNGVVQTQNFDVFFAKSIDGVAPPTLGDANDAKNVIKTQKARPYIIGHHGVDSSLLEDVGNGLVAYNVLGNGKPEENYQVFHMPVMIEGEPEHCSVKGYQTIYVAAIAHGAFDFGTGVLLNQAGNQAQSLTTAVDLVIDGSDSDDIFAIGDDLISFVAADGTSPKLIGKVTSIPDDVSIVVDKVAEAFNDDTEICNRSPITMRFGLEY
tara:strand:- start:295 stop:1080 length:786 start_codon:yes stop_codon:yes gene_type:complete